MRIKFMMFSLLALGLLSACSSSQKVEFNAEKYFEDKYKDDFIVIKEEYVPAHTEFDYSKTYGYEFSLASDNSKTFHGEVYISADGKEIVCSDNYSQFEYASDSKQLLENLLDGRGLVTDVVYSITSEDINSLYDFNREVAKYIIVVNEPESTDETFVDDIMNLCDDLEANFFASSIVTDRGSSLVHWSVFNSEYVSSDNMRQSIESALGIK